MNLTDLLQKVNIENYDKKIIVKDTYNWNNIKEVIVRDDAIILIKDETVAFGKDAWKGDEKNMKIYIDIINKKNSFEIMEKLEAMGCYILEDGKVSDKLNKVLEDKPDVVYVIDIEDIDLEIKTSKDCRQTLINPEKTNTDGYMLVGRTQDVYNYIEKMNAMFIFIDLKETNNEEETAEDVNIIDFGTVEILLGSYLTETEANEDKERMNQCGISCTIKKNNKKYFVILTCDASNKNIIEKRLKQLGLDGITENDVINSFKVGNRARVKSNAYNVNGVKLNNASDIYVIRKIEGFTAYIYRTNSNVLYDKIHLKFLYKI